MNTTTNKIISCGLAVLLLAVQLGAAVSPACAGDTADDLKQIQYKYYFRGKYDQAITALKTYLARTDLDEVDVRAAREFLAASYVLSGDGERGREEFISLLNLFDGYAGPDPAVFKPDVVAAFNDAQQVYASSRIKQVPAEVETSSVPPPLAATESGKPLYKRWWLYAGVATVLLIAGAVSRENSDDPPGAAETGTVSVGVRVR